MMPDTLPKGLKIRIRIIQAGLVLIMLVLAGKSFDIQILQAGTLSRKAQSGHSGILEIKGERGQILDRNWTKLGTSVAALTLEADPSQITDPGKAAAQITHILKLDTDSLTRKLSSDKRYALIHEDITPAQADQIRDLNLTGIYLKKGYKRVYPNRDLAAQVLGFTGENGKGLEGLEFRYNDILEGKTAKIRVLRDGTGRILTIADRPEKELRGNSIVLTLDKRIQFAAEKAVEQAVIKHQAKTGMAVVMRPATGEIMAMAHYPRFNPNTYLNFDRTSYRNRIVTDAFEPGSTLKIFTAAAALENGLQPGHVFNCENGRYRIGRYVIRDTHPQGLLTIRQIIQVSSNIGAAKMAETIGKPALHLYLERFGFGSRTLIESPGETPGSLMPYPKWSNIDTGAIAFGQGISVSAIQLTAGISAIANNGILMKPMLIKKIISSAGDDLEVFHPVVRNNVITPATAAEVREMMRLAVLEEGTGKQAVLEGYEVCGKTGTAQKVVDGVKGYAKGKYVSVFGGFAPKDRPELAILVMVDEPGYKYYGGEVAAPAFRAILADAVNHLNIAPEALVATVPEKKGDSL